MQTNMPREIKDIIRNVQQMDLPENGIADIRIKIQGGEVMDRPMFKKRRWRKQVSRPQW